mgnify:CR=1 FL=1
MDKILVDTNIVLDLLAKRKEFIAEAQQLFTLSDKNEVELYVSSLTFANTYYILSQKTKLNYINVVSVSTTNLSIENALNVFPNPVLNGQVNVGFNLKKSTDVEITLMDVQGRIVKVLKSENFSTGTYQETLKVGNELQGIYFLNVKIGTEQQSFRLLLN